MNNIGIKGYLRDIEFSHDIGGVEYNKAKIISPGVNGKEDDLFNIVYKKFSNRYKEGDFIEFKGNLRSYSVKEDNGKSSVQIYVFTYFDLPDLTPNHARIDGRICKIGELQETHYGKKYIHFTLANNIITPTAKLNSYIPCTAFDEVAEQLSHNRVNDFIDLWGTFHSHNFKKYLPNNIVEYRVAHEVILDNYLQKTV